MSVISIAIQKGGSGKTTTAINLAAALREQGHRVLLLDLDPQSNLTHALGVAPDTDTVKSGQRDTIYELLKKEAVGDAIDLSKALTDTNGMQLIPATLELSFSEWELVGVFGRENLLRSILEPVRFQYDYILIDCPPAVGILTVNALMASDYVLIPMQAEFLPLKGIESFMYSFDRVLRLNKKLQVLGVLITRFAPRHNMTHQVIGQLEHTYGDTLLHTRIRTNIALAKAQEKGVDIFRFDPHSNGARNYRDLAVEIRTRIDQLSQKR